jgi:hypothetical protein
MVAGGAGAAGADCAEAAPTEQRSERTIDVVVFIRLTSY